MTLDAIIREVKQLSPADQAELFDELTRLMNPGLADVTLTPTQRADLDKRIAEFRSGKAVMLDGDEVFARLRKRD